MLRYTVLLRRNREVPGYSVIVPELPGCFSQGRTYEEAIANAKEAIECHLEAMTEDGEEIPVEEEPFVTTSIAVSIVGESPLSDRVGSRNGNRLREDELWQRVRGLEGETIFTIKQHRPNRILDVTENEVIIESRGSRPTRENIFWTYQHLWEEREITQDNMPGRFFDRGGTARILLAILVAAVPDQVEAFKSGGGRTGLQSGIRLRS